MTLTAYRIRCACGIDHLYASTDRDDVEFEIHNLESAPKDSTEYAYGFCEGPHEIVDFTCEWPVL